MLGQHDPGTGKHKHVFIAFLLTTEEILKPKAPEKAVLRK